MHRHCPLHMSPSPVLDKNQTHEASQHPTYIERLLQSAMEGEPKCRLETNHPFRGQDAPAAQTWRYQTCLMQILFASMSCRNVFYRHSLLFPAAVLSSKSTFIMPASGKNVAITSDLNDTNKTNAVVVYEERGVVIDSTGDKSIILSGQLDL